MDWPERMNRAITWIEQHLMEEVEWDGAARAAACSLFHFPRMFEVITGVTAGEYVRRRRLSLVALELASGDARIIDVALRSGYDSPAMPLPRPSASCSVARLPRRAGRAPACAPIHRSPFQSPSKERAPWTIASRPSPPLA